MVLGPDGKPLPIVVAVLPTSDGLVHRACLAGLVQVLGTPHCQAVVAESPTKLLGAFARARASTLVMVSGLVGFHGRDVASLVGLRADLVSGTYPGERVTLRGPAYGRAGKVASVEACLPGFVAISHACARRMWEAHGSACWLPSVSPEGDEEHPIAGFSRRWRELGGDVLVAADVRVERYGMVLYPEDADAAPNLPGRPERSPIADG